jgi:uncharacterized membrane protein
MDTPNNTTGGEQTLKHSAETEKNNRMLFGILSYLGPLVIVSLLVKKDDAFVKFHIKQGLVLLSIQIILWFFSSMMWSLWPLYNIINLALLVFSVLGIINVVQGKEKELPLIGGLASHFPV